MTKNPPPEAGEAATKRGGGSNGNLQGTSGANEKSKARRRMPRPAQEVKKIRYRTMLPGSIPQHRFSGSDNRIGGISSRFYPAVAWSRELIQTLHQSAKGVKAVSRESTSAITEMASAILARRLACRFSYRKAFPSSVILGW